MIAALLLGFAPPGQVPTPPTDEIVVTGQRLKDVRIGLKRDRRTGIRRCFLKPSTGDAVLDAGICAVYMDCSVTARTASALEACMRPPLTQQVNDWMARRKAAVAVPR